MRILGIETSCDDTGAAIFDESAGLMAHVLYSQTTTHLPYGGVVPELASRDHAAKLLPLVEAVIEKAGIAKDSLDGIAYTAGPGLMGALLVGASFAKALGYAWHIPTIGIHHMEGHLLAPMLEAEKPSFPFVALLVSGGHTLLVRVAGIGQYQTLGQSLDDAAGEAFDKVAKQLGLPYPGGPHLSKLAEKGNAQRFDFPRPLTQKPGCDFSFSGLKTFTLNAFKKTDASEQDKADIAAGFQAAVVETLCIKCERALKETGFNQLVIAGGVGANLALRDALFQLGKKKQYAIFYPRPEFCTDNGAMIAYAGFRRLKAGQKDANLEILAYPRWALDTLPPL